MLSADCLNRNVSKIYNFILNCSLNVYLSRESMGFRFGPRFCPFPSPNQKFSCTTSDVRIYRGNTTYIWVYGMLESVHRKCYQSTNLSQIEVSCSEGGNAEGFFFQNFTYFDKKCFSSFKGVRSQIMTFLVLFPYSAIKQVSKTQTNKL